MSQEEGINLTINPQDETQDELTTDIKHVKEPLPDDFLMLLCPIACIMTIIFIFTCLYAVGVFDVHHKEYYCDTKGYFLNTTDLTCCVREVTTGHIFCVPATSSKDQQIGAIICCVVSGLLSCITYGSAVQKSSKMTKLQLAFLLFFPLGGVVANLIILLI